MSVSIDRRELIGKAAAGLVGGALGWIPVEIVNHGHMLTEAVSTAEVILNFIASALVAGLIGGLILAAEGQTFEITARVKRRLLTGFIICFFLSLPTTLYANKVFRVILSAGGWDVNQAGSIIYLFIGRVVAWTMMGAMLGLGVGLSTWSLRNVVKGAAGGALGGFVGGLLFDPMGSLSTSGMLSRFIGFSLVGLAIGLFIGLVQELTKAAWLAVEAGRLRGRQFRLEAATVTIGRAEENAVGLFGDTAVQARHALIEKQGANFSIKNLAVQEGTFLNGSRIESAPLHDGDRIRISNYELSFHERAAPGSGAALAGAPPASATVKPAGALSSTASAAAASAAYLSARNGARFELRAGASTRLGRALDNDIVIDDGSVSRHHAAIEAINGEFRLRDLGSQNGTYLGGQRISEAPIGNGDSLRLGDAMFIFHA